VTIWKEYITSCMAYNAAATICHCPCTWWLEQRPWPWPVSLEVITSATGNVNTASPCVPSFAFASRFMSRRVKLTIWPNDLDLWSHWACLWCVLKLHPFINYEVCIPSHSEDMADFSVTVLNGMWPWPLTCHLRPG